MPRKPIDKAQENDERTENAMTTATTTLTTFEIPFFELPPTMCKVYNDGGHYIATPYFPDERRRAPRGEYELQELREVFETLYAYTITAEMKRAETLDFLRDNLCHLFATAENLNDFITHEMKRKARCLHMRKSRFYRKANMNRWTYFVTFTYSDEKHTESEFRRKLRRCLCNLATRRKWRCMGVFERAPETGRLHFHALLYIPDGEMIGEITEKTDYSTKQHKMQTTHENDFFAERFGRNDFAELCAYDMPRTIGYILKYIGKTGERITYSRGIRGEIFKTIEGKDIVCEMRDFVLKYILFDSVINWERDIMHYKQKQMTFADISPHWLC